MQVDKDNSGFVDKTELKVLLEKLNLRIDDLSVQFMLNRYDDDKNNMLNFEEFRYLIHYIETERRNKKKKKEKGRGKKKKKKRDL